MRNPCQGDETWQQPTIRYCLLYCWSALSMRCACARQLQYCNNIVQDKTIIDSISAWLNDTRTVPYLTRVLVQAKELRRTCLMNDW